MAVAAAVTAVLLLRLLLPLIISCCYDDLKFLMGKKKFIFILFIYLIYFIHSLIYCYLLIEYYDNKLYFFSLWSNKFWKKNIFFLEGGGEGGFLCFFFALKKLFDWKFWHCCCAKKKKKKKRLYLFSCYESVEMIDWLTDCLRLAKVPFCVSSLNTAKAKAIANLSASVTELPRLFSVIQTTVALTV